MNFNAVNVVMFSVGGLLIYCAVKDKTPKDVLTDAFTKSAASPGTKSSTGATSAANGAVHTPGVTSGSSPEFAAPFTSRPVITSN